MRRTSGGLIKVSCQFHPDHWAEIESLRIEGESTANTIRRLVEIAIPITKKQRELHDLVEATLTEGAA